MPIGNPCVSKQRMDISYTLYFIHLKQLRSEIKSVYTRSLAGNYTYEYTELTHIEDIDKTKLPSTLPRTVIAQVRVCYSEFVLLWGIKKVINRVWLSSDGTFILDIPDLSLNIAVNKWIKFVIDKHVNSPNY